MKKLTARDFEDLLQVCVGYMVHVGIKSSMLNIFSSVQCQSLRHCSSVATGSALNRNLAERAGASADPS